MDALFFTTLPTPHPSVVNVASTGGVKFLPISDDKVKEMMNKYKGIIPISLPANTYTGQKEAVKGLATSQHFVAANDMPEDVVYAIVKTIGDNLAKYQGVAANMKTLTDPKDIAIDLGMPFHPGALKYYKEKGWVK